MSLSRVLRSNLKLIVIVVALNYYDLSRKFSGRLKGMDSHVWLQNTKMPTDSGLGVKDAFKYECNKFAAPRVVITLTVQLIKTLYFERMFPRDPYSRNDCQSEQSHSCKTCPECEQ